VHPLWGPEFFGDTILVNGRAWPKLEVAPVRYRFRILNACNARFLILKLNHTGLNFWVIAADRGYIHQRAASVDQVLVGPSERIDVIIDFANVSGENILLQNVGPDEPLGGDKPDPADSDSTGQVMLFSVVLPQVQDQSTPPNQLILPNITRLTTSSCTKIRKLSITEQNSTSVRMRQDSDKSVHLDCSADDFYGPIRSLLGTYQGNGTDGKANPLMWSDPTTEIMKPGVTEIWEIYDLSEDAHPIHIHQVGFQVLKRVPFDDSEEATDPEPWETGYKDTVIVYPDQLTRIAIKPDIEGLFVWHCHMLEHEDNEMMRPLVIRRQQ
jgi:FtsP/CotA-like multicopper oxidase with cupredoxin domain